MNYTSEQLKRCIEATIVTVLLDSLLMEDLKVNKGCSFGSETYSTIPSYSGFVPSDDPTSYPTDYAIAPAQISPPPSPDSIFCSTFPGFPALNMLQSEQEEVNSEQGGHETLGLGFDFAILDQGVDILVCEDDGKMAHTNLAPTFPPQSPILPGAFNSTPPNVPFPLPSPISPSPSPRTSIRSGKKPRSPTSKRSVSRDLEDVKPIAKKPRAVIIRHTLNLAKHQDDVYLVHGFTGPTSAALNDNLIRRLYQYSDAPHRFFSPATTRWGRSEWELLEDQTTILCLTADAIPGALNFEFFHFPPNSIVLHSSKPIGYGKWWELQSCEGQHGSQGPWSSANRKPARCIHHHAHCTSGTVLCRFARRVTSSFPGTERREGWILEAEL